MTKSRLLGGAVALAIAMLTSGTASAASASAEISVTSFGAGDGGEGIYIWPKGAIASPAIACANNRFIMPATTALFDANFSILLAAVAQRVPVVLVYDGSACSSGNWRVIAVRMNVT